MKVKVNLNNWVHVKLTPFGIAIVEEKYDEIFHDRLAGFSRKVGVDKNGYTRFQFWSFMEIFGKYSYCGMAKMPYETDIIIDNTEPMEEEGESKNGN